MIQILLLFFLDIALAQDKIKSCDMLSMKKYKGIPHAHNQFKSECKGAEIKYTSELCQKALVHLMSTQSLPLTKKKFGDPVEHCFTGDDIRRFAH